MIVGFALASLACTASAGVERTVEAPRRSWPTALAIVIDSTSAREVRAELNRYRDALESSGFSVWIGIDAWERPEAVRDWLAKLQREERLEGAVLLGDIPLVRVSQAAHLTRDGAEGAVESDVYYCDFDLS